MHIQSMYEVILENTSILSFSIDLRWISGPQAAGRKMSRSALGCSLRNVLGVTFWTHRVFLPVAF